MFSDTALPASLSALHLALAMLRRHRAGARGALSPFVFPSFLFTALPWLSPAPWALAAGVGAHLLWIIACEVLAPPPARAPSAPARPAAARSQAAAAAAATAAPSSTTRPSAPPRGFQPTTVLSVIEESDEIRTIRLARPEGFDFQPGQFVPVRLQIDGKPHVRCYSISSAPDTRGYLEISVRNQGLVSGTLHATMRAGATLSINRPAGQFVYPGGDDRPIALLAGGIGITPLLSMLRHAVASDPTRPVTLLYSARREQDIAFLDELRVLAARHPQIRVAITLTRPAAPCRTEDGVRWREGRIDAALIRQYVPAPQHTVFCLCGPPAMLDALTTLLPTLGAPAPQVRFEHFETAVAASLVNPAAGDRAETTPASQPDTGYRVTFASSGRSAVAAASTTLLEAAEAEGIAIPSSCRSGVCQACRTRLAEGQADCRSDVLDPDDRDAGFVLPCVTWATSDCVLDA
ncbi:MAG: 2Fe-2S iron-sulfur cluster-binding protein [Vicinamibacterales bacterium]